MEETKDVEANFEDHLRGSGDTWRGVFRRKEHEEDMDFEGNLKMILINDNIYDPGFSKMKKDQFKRKSKLIEKAPFEELRKFAEKKKAIQKKET